MAATAAPINPIPSLADYEVSRVGGVLIPLDGVVVLPQEAEVVQEKKAASVTLMFGPAPSARPDSLLFGALADPGLRLRKPIQLEVCAEDGHVALTWQDIDEFGCGSTTTEALADFAQSIRELYHHLHDGGVKLGVDLERVKGVLDSYIEPRK